ncbi:MAG: hypothetical protein ACRERR_06515 [Moraxellaceae bacterium]
MNNDDKNLHDKDRHDADLHDKNISALYRQLPDETPSANTDALIRAAARRAVGASPRKTLFTARVQRLLATAATLVLGVALLAQWQREPERLQEMMAAAPAASAPLAEDAPASISADALDAPFLKAEPARPAAPAMTAEKRKAIAAPKEEKFSRPETTSPVLGSAGAIAAAPAPLSVQPEETPLAEPELAEKAVMANRTDAAESALMRQGMASRARESDAADTLKKQAPAAASIRGSLALKNAEASKADMGLVDKSIALLPYQQAMQAGNWQQAETALGHARPTDAAIQRMDRQLLASLQKNAAAPNCENLLASDALLCQFIGVRKSGKPLPADALEQLEKSGAISGSLLYRRAAVLKWLEQP